MYPCTCLLTILLFTLTGGALASTHLHEKSHRAADKALDEIRAVAASGVAVGPSGEKLRIAEALITASARQYQQQHGGNGGTLMPPGQKGAPLPGSGASFSGGGGGGGGSAVYRGTWGKGSVPGDSVDVAVTDTALSSEAVNKRDSGPRSPLALLDAAIAVADKRSVHRNLVRGRGGGTVHLKLVRGRGEGWRGQGDDGKGAESASRK